MDRKQPKLKPCSADAWQACLIAMNEQKDVVRIERASLEEVASCHQAKEGRISRDLVVQGGRRYVKVNRHQLWNLVQEHGKVCK